MNILKILSYRFIVVNQNSLDTRFSNIIIHNRLGFSYKIKPILWWHNEISPRLASGTVWVMFWSQKVWPNDQNTFLKIWAHTLQTCSHWYDYNDSTWLTAESLAQIYHDPCRWIRDQLLAPRNLSKLKTTRYVQVYYVWNLTQIIHTLRYDKSYYIYKMEIAAHI